MWATSASASKCPFASAVCVVVTVPARVVNVPPAWGLDEPSRGSRSVMSPEITVFM